MNERESGAVESSGSLVVQELPEGAWQSLSHRYLLYSPAGAATRPQPLILFLHGAGERGEDPDLVRQQGLPRRLSDGAALPFVVLAPQCPVDQQWEPQSLASLLDYVQGARAIDPDHVIVTGMSMGGRGAWSLAIAYPNRFAAIAPICGRGDPSAVCAIAHVPVWAFHGALDAVVPVQRSIEMVDALRACGGDVRLTVYPQAEHDSWTETYANQELYAWLLAQRRQ
jgi:predicted peptidase